MVFTFKVMPFRIVKKSPKIWATFLRKFAAINFQLSPNLVTLLLMLAYACVLATNLRAKSKHTLLTRPAVNTIHHSLNDAIHIFPQK